MRRPSNAILFIAAGLYLALGAVAGYTTVNAIVLLLIGIERYRSDRSRISIIVIVICTLALIITQFALFAVVVLVSLGIYYFRGRPPTAGNTYESKHRLFLNMRLDEQSWVLHSMSYWHAIGEIRMDMSLAVPEDKETTIVLQGLVGDVDLIVPDDYGIQVEASVLIGQVSFKQIKEGGMLHRLSWRSPNYDQCDQRLKLQLFYLVGDIKIRTE
ncbi:cell wall-active antibiotics response protein LiaF [Cohnella cholangitidis]|uniref:Cell wall-active antibiotics response LiaF-like C-terminal domain-containing protein n=1 Tax=Cohnella cholangitidis TaxID=2598458 RepID=A0A7G5BVM8_9BACL|nr:cell wall-active antibiotics response protein LiaF [Cohnella cholangitidis]QMV41012.1 hypothetical protein FPL14_07170 [Cohnella cholangitidis]